MGIRESRDKWNAYMREYRKRPKRQAYLKSYYAGENGEKRKRYLKARYRRQMEQIREIKAQRGCQDCGEKDPIVLEFDHRDPSSKTRKKSVRTHNPIHPCLNWERLLIEIAKCDVRCAKCHRRRTYKQYQEGIL